MNNIYRVFGVSWMCQSKCLIEKMFYANWNHWSKDVLIGRFFRHFPDRRIISDSEKRRRIRLLFPRWSTLLAPSSALWVGWWWNKYNSSSFRRIICRSSSECVDTSSSREQRLLLNLFFCGMLSAGFLKLFFRFMQDFLKFSPNYNNTIVSIL